MRVSSFKPLKGSENLIDRLLGVRKIKPHSNQSLTPYLWQHFLILIIPGKYWKILLLNSILLRGESQGQIQPKSAPFLQFRPRKALVTMTRVLTTVSSWTKIFCQKGSTNNIRKIPNIYLRIYALVALSSMFELFLAYSFHFNNKWCVIYICVPYRIYI